MNSDMGDSVSQEHESFVKSVRVKWPAVTLLVTEKDTYLKINLKFAVMPVNVP